MKFTLNESNWQSVGRSALISIGAIIVAVAVYYGLGLAFPGEDLTMIKAAILTAASGWVINFIKEGLSKD